MKPDRAASDAIVDFGCFAWVTDEDYGRLEPLSAAGAVGFQAPLAERPLDSGELLVAMNRCLTTGRRLGVHVEDGAILDVRWAAVEANGHGDRSTTVEAGCRPPVTEAVGVRTVLELARETGCPLHVFQVRPGRRSNPSSGGDPRGWT